MVRVRCFVSSDCVFCYKTQHPQETRPYITNIVHCATCNKVWPTMKDKGVVVVVVSLPLLSRFH